jgi:hypothetical protein
MPAQRELTQAEYIALTDCYAQAIREMIDAIGDEDTPGTVADYAADARNEITAFTMPDEAQLTADLIDAAIEVCTQIGYTRNLATFFSTFNAAVTRHLGQDVNTWLALGSDRVHYYFRQGGNSALLPANVFPPATALGSFAVTGSGAGTFTDGDAVDTTLYGGAQISVKTTHAIGAVAIGLTITCLDEDGEEVEVTGTIPENTLNDATIELGTAADRIVDVTAVEITGGTADDAFTVQTVEDRTLA